MSEQKETAKPAEATANSFGIEPDGLSRLKQLELDSGTGAALVAESSNLTYTIKAVNDKGGALYAEARSGDANFTHAAITAVTGANNALQCKSEGDVACAYVENGGTGYDFFGAGDRPFGRSDATRQKRGIQTLTQALATLRKLVGVRFTWLENNRKDVGFVAEHVAKHLPEAAKLDDRGDVQGMSYDTIVPLLVEAVKELDKRPGGTPGTGEVTAADLARLKDELNATIEKLRGDWQAGEVGEVTPEHLATLKTELNAAVEKLRGDWQAGEVGVATQEQLVLLKAELNAAIEKLRGDWQAGEVGEVTPENLALLKTELSAAIEKLRGDWQAGEVGVATQEQLELLKAELSAVIEKLRGDWQAGEVGEVTPENLATLKTELNAAIEKLRGDWQAGEVGEVTPENLALLKSELSAAIEKLRGDWQAGEVGVATQEQLALLKTELSAVIEKLRGDWQAGEVGVATQEQLALLKTELTAAIEKLRGDWQAGEVGEVTPENLATLKSELTAAIEKLRNECCPQEGMLPVEKPAILPEHCLELDGAEDWVDCGEVLADSYSLVAWVLKVGLHGKLGLGEKGEEQRKAVKWSFVAITYDASQKSLSLYREGARVAEATSATLRDASATSLKLGRSGLGAYFRGRLSMISIWDRALPAGEVLALMSQAPLESAPGLVAYYAADAIKQDATARWITGQGGEKAMLHGDVRLVRSGEPIAAPPAGAIVVPLRTRPVIPDHCLEFDTAESRVACGDVLLETHTRTAWIFDTTAARNQASGGEWIFLVATCNKRQKTLRYYRNGKQTSVMHNALLRDNMTPSLRLGGGSFRGRVAAVSVWDRVLSIGQIRTLMDKAPLASDAGLVEYWPLDGIEGAAGARYVAGVRGRKAIVSDQVHTVKSTASIPSDGTKPATHSLRVETTAGTHVDLLADLAGGALETNGSRLRFQVGNDDKLVLDKADNHVLQGTLHQASDVRQKREVAPIAKPLEKVLALRGVNFRKQSAVLKSPSQIGFVAQEIEPVVPEVVHTDEQGYKSVSYQNLTALLVEAIKAQQGQISAQNERLDRQEAELVAMRAALDQ